jgi:signal transduction histidine kinase
MGPVRFEVEPTLVPGMREACHEMRQPVTSMVALAATALAEPDLPQPTRARLQQIMEQAEWLADLIQHSLHTAGPGVPAACQTDLSRVVDDAIAAERLTWPGDVRVLEGPGPVLVAVHSVLLRRMVANLLSNATRAAGPSGRVTIKIGVTPRSATLAIEDTGPGFGNIVPGLGLGLAAVSRCAAAYDGGLDLGRGADGGTRVSLCLPRMMGSAHGDGSDNGFRGAMSAATRSTPYRPAAVGASACPKPGIGSHA